MAPRAGAPHRAIARYPRSHSGGLCPHRVAACLTRATARSKVNSGVNANRAPVRIGLEVPKEGKRSKNGKRIKGAIVIGLEQTWTLWKEESNTYNSHAEHFVRF
ncbi:hypothetical protein PIB30_099992 [Stylosanthes scabra]|uniref:Uncharacterized protein n=1 Tax=Stylosanthes scabra TaxID=79078 RepID=A0ABU6SXC3_9FABA|nr:hypothetical protein [Stylosanthes scabra]